MKKYLKQICRFFYHCSLYFYQGFKANLLTHYLKTFLSTSSTHLGKFHHHLQQMVGNKHAHYHALQMRIQGLHSLLPQSNYSYSILIPLDHPTPKLLKSCLLSACRQTAPHFEILLGSKTEMSTEQSSVIQEIQSQYPNRVRLFNFPEAVDSFSLYNLLSLKAQGNFLFFLEGEDWIRPDLLFRFEQLLRTIGNQDHIIVDCYEDEMTEKDHFIPASQREKQPLHFPYIFNLCPSLRGRLIPKNIWSKVLTFHPNHTAEAILKCDLVGAHFHTIPLCLYSCRKKRKKKEENNSPHLFLKTLSNYSKEKNLNWSFEQGYQPNTIRAIPHPTKMHRTQIIIPFKEQKEMTLSCIKKAIAQKNAAFTITAIDNGSTDFSIADEIKSLGIEVIRVEEPFNYSRLNNNAASLSHHKDCDLILFLNNDVELDEYALQEMCRWIGQPDIGMVGARLHYPNGQLQHGGVQLDAHAFPDHLRWEHREKHSVFAEMQITKTLGIVDAVTAACALIKKEDFLKVGGFDEVLYPIGFSDTNLAVKLRKIGLHCFYTPYAHGIHYESISRKYFLEDFEASRWLHELIS
jgi:GT2 family glycosyltransferase